MDNKIILNKGTDTELVFPFTEYHEKVITATLTAKMTFSIEPGMVIPPIPSVATPEVNTLEVIFNGAVYPTACNYTVITQYSAEYGAETKELTYLLELGI